MIQQIPKTHVVMSDIPHKLDSGQRGVNTANQSLSLSKILHNLLYIIYITMRCTKNRTRSLARVRSV